MDEKYVWWRLSEICIFNLTEVYFNSKLSVPKTESIDGKLSVIVCGCQVQSDTDTVGNVRYLILPSRIASLSGEQVRFPGYQCGLKFRWMWYRWK